jgi:hypothetical protein
MRVRAVAVSVAAALAVWCMSEVAMAGGYTEVWNPPEASGHVARQSSARKKPAAVKAKAGSTQKKQTASVRHGAPHVASGGAGHGGKLAAQGGKGKHLAAAGKVKGAGKGAGKGSVKVAAAGQKRTHAGVTTAQGAKRTQPHVQQTQLAHAKPAQGKVVRADFAAGRTARPHVERIAAKPAVSHANPIRPAVQRSSDGSANVSDIAPMGSVPNPATASSGSLPPIIH